MKTAKDVIQQDLAYLSDSLKPEFLAMSGKRLLVTGGAGFLGHYFVQGALYWNRVNRDHAPITVVVYDSFVRGMPSWLISLPHICSSRKHRRHGQNKTPQWAHPPRARNTRRER